MKIDMIGKKYGKLTVIAEVGKDHRGYRYNCICDCGNQADYVAGADLRQGHKTSCGCNIKNRRKTHGMVGTKPYHTWSNMKRRCDDADHKEYKNYGAKGITYCDKWAAFEGFWEDMHEGYLDGSTLERIDPDEGYCKENCRWLNTHYNKRHNLVFSFGGQEMTLNQIAELTGINYNSIKNRLRQGMSIEEAVNIPSREQITYNGVTKSISEHARDAGMTYRQLKKRLMHGWSVEKAMTQPIRRNRKHQEVN